MAKTSTVVCIEAADVPEVLGEMAAWAHLRGLAQDIRGVRVA